jgi:spermidine synthase
VRQRSPRLIAFLFVVSGFTALVYQVVLSRYVQLIVGGTAYAVSALLVAFMLGMSLGSALGGRWADRTTHPLRLYALPKVRSASTVPGSRSSSRCFKSCT